MTFDRPACEGGAPVRATFLQFARPDLGPEEEAAVVEVLRSGWISTGPRTADFEAAYGRYVGVRHAIGVASCTAGLHLVLRALGVGEGDEVITSPITFPATLNAILWAGARPVLADVLPTSLGLDARQVRNCLSPRTRALLPVHFAGWPCDMAAIQAVADEARIPVIEDAAHAIGATYRGRQAGALADVGVTSFYATKNITTAEGGMITTDREDLAPLLRTNRLHGIDVDASQRAAEEYRHWEAVSMGWKANLTDIASAMGLAQLAKLPGFLARRRQLDGRYRRELAGLNCFDFIDGPAEAESAAHLFPMLIRPGCLRLGRDGMLKALLAENVGVGVHFRAIPLHRHFREVLGIGPEQVPVASEASERIFSLPLYPGMTDGDQDDVIRAVARVVAYYRV